MLCGSGSLLICVSGGADSMCLLEVMRRLSCDVGFSIAVAHFNHELRGEESDRDEAFVKEVCDGLGIPFYVGRGNVAEFAKGHGLSVEEAARDMRYEFFYDVASKVGATCIATAHTLDDNAETMLINLARGAGAKGMSGIPPVRGLGGRLHNVTQIIRPLLCVFRDEVMEFVSEHGVVYVEDSTNSSDVYTRNKIRHNVVPLLRELNPRFVDAAGVTAQLLRADESFIDGVADAFIEESCVDDKVSVEKLLDLPFAVSSRVIRKLYGGSLSFGHVRDVLSLCASSNPSASLSLPGMVVCREYEFLVFGSKSMEANCGIDPIYPVEGSSYVMSSAGIKMSCKTAIYDENLCKAEINTSFTSFVFKSIDICGKITVRSRFEGDYIKFPGKRGTKSLKKLFIEKRIPARERNLCPIICDEQGVLGVYKLGVGERARPELGDSVTILIFEDLRREH